MKKISLILAVLFLASSVTFISCETDETDKKSENILPENFKVDIPNSISKAASKKSISDDDVINGNAIYENLSFFIALGEGASEIVEEIMIAIAVHGINQPMEFSFSGDDDGRTKNLKVIENATFEGKAYKYQLTITDAESESNADGGKAMQVMWNNDPVDGVAILKPYNIDRHNDENMGEAIFRIDYNEIGANGYDAEMTVQIADFPMPSPLIDPYGVNNIKMFAGKKGDIVDVYGNSNHPNASFFTDSKGFNWAFVASGKESEDIGVAEVGLPPSTLDETNRDVLLDYYSIHNVFTRAIYETWPGIDSLTVATYLVDTEAPGFFDANGFVQGGDSPGTEYDEIESRLDNMIPYNPKDINELQLVFND